MAYVEQGGKLVWQEPNTPATPTTTTQLNQTTGLLEKVPVSVTELGNTPTPQVETPVPTKADPYMDSIKKYQDEYKALSQSVVNPYEQKMKDLTTQYETSLGQQGSKAEALESAYAQAGIPEQQKRLQDLNLQIAQMTASYDKGLVDIEGKVMPMQFITGQQAQMQKMKAAEVGALTSIQQAMTGNIELARETAREAVALKFEDEQNRIDSIRSQLELNYENFSREEKKKADEMNYVLTKQQAELDEKRENESNVASVMVQAAQLGADQATLNKIKNAKTLADAILAAGDSFAPKATGVNGDWSIVDVNGESYMFEKNTGTLRPTTSDSSQNYFTDANGTAWNMDGWAVDPSKAQQMQAISDRIGKVTDENIDAKVAQFAPGLTADMVKNTSAKTGVSWEALLTMAVQESLGGTSNVAKKNNNYAGLTWSENTQWKAYGGTKGTARPSAEGGNYIKFPTPQAGLDAMGALMAQYGTVSTQPQVDQEVADFATRVQSGNLTDKEALGLISKGKQKDLINALANTPKPTDTVDLANTKSQKAKIDTILNSRALNDAVGPNAFSRDWSPFDLSKASGEYQTFVGNVKNLIDQLTLDKLVEAKKAGATFGALSDTELNMLSTAASSINSYAVKYPSGPNKGEIAGFNTSEDTFKAELNRIKSLYDTAVQRRTDSNYRTLQDGSIWIENPDGSLTKVE